MRLLAGAQVPDLENAAERLAAFLGVREVRVTRDPSNARYARVVVLRRDPLADPQPIPWPLVMAGRCSLWAPIPVGEDEDGTQVTVTLPERNLLAGGEPGAGKSTVVQVLIAAAALDPSVVLTLFDPKLVELAVWQGCAHRLVGPNVDEAIDVLKRLISELDDRYLTLLANRARKVALGDGLPLHLVVVEELAFYTNGPDRKASAAFSTLLRDFVARGRAAGMVTVATTQKPSADVVPTFLRDLFGFRWALRCSTPRPATRSSAVAGPARATQPRRSTQPPAGWASCKRAASRSGCALAIWTTLSWPISPGGPSTFAAQAGRRRHVVAAGQHRMTEPVLVGDAAGVVAEAIARAGPGYDRWAEQVAATGYCTHPVRLRGRVDHADPQTGRSGPSTRPTGSTTPLCSRPAATGGPRSARPAQRPTRPTASSSWPLACEVAKVSRRRSPSILDCS